MNKKKIIDLYSSLKTVEGRNKVAEDIKKAVAEAKCKIMDLASSLKTAEGRTAFAVKTRELSIEETHKVVSFWKSGVKGKVVVSLVAILFLWMIFPSGSGNTRIQLKKLRDSDALFFEGTLPKNVKTSLNIEDILSKVDLGEGGARHGVTYKPVAPNLIILPETISFEGLCGVFNPEIKGLRKKGMSFLNDPEEVLGPNLGHTIVVHVGSDYVIAKPSNTRWYGNFHGYIETDDSYVEGARLRTGFYTYLGRRKTVELVNGSSRTMYMFEKLEESDDVLEAIKYNLTAIEAAKKENERRLTEAIAKKSNERCAAISEAFRKEAKRFKAFDVQSQIHLPRTLKDKGVAFADIKTDQGNRIDWGFSEYWTTLGEIKKSFAKGDWQYLSSVSRFYGYEKSSPKEYAKELVNLILGGYKCVSVKGIDIAQICSDYVIVNILTDRIEEYYWSKNLLAYGKGVKIPLGYELYVVPVSDQELLGMARDDRKFDVQKFIEAFHKKYGN